MKKVLTCRIKTALGMKTYVWDATGITKRNEAYLSYFDTMCELRVFPPKNMSMVEHQVYDAASRGNSAMARAFVALMDDGSDNYSNPVEVDVENSEDDNRKVVKIDVADLAGSID